MICESLYDALKLSVRIADRHAFILPYASLLQNTSITTHTRRVVGLPFVLCLPLVALGLQHFLLCFEAFLRLFRTRLFRPDIVTCSFCHRPRVYTNPLNSPIGREHLFCIPRGCPPVFARRRAGY